MRLFPLGLVYVLMLIDGVYTELPTVKIAANCPTGTNVTKDNFIRYGTNATCICERTRAGSPAGRAEWYSSTGAEVGESFGNNGYSLLLINTTDVSLENYTCRGVSSEGQTEPGLFFTPQIVYGPTKVKVTSEKMYFDLCPNEKKTLNITCSVPIDDVYPAPLFRIYYTELGGLEHIPAYHGKIDVNDGVYRAVSNFRPKAPGKLHIKCQGFSSIFHGLEAESTLNRAFDIRGPPSNPPTIKIKGRSYQKPAIIQIPKSLEDVEVECEVTGGNPRVSSVTLSCNTFTKTSVGTQVLLQFPVRRDQTLSSCVCIATHLTGCYDLQTNVTLDVVYQPIVTSFSANNVNTSLEVNRGDSIIFKCSVDANPVPTLSLERERPNFNARITMESETLESTLINVHCSDTEVYYCKADNGVDTGDKISSQRSLKVFVHCPPQLKDKNTEGKKFEATIGQKITITIEILGHPEVYTKYILGQLLSHNGVIKDVNKSRYSAKYRPGTPPYGAMDLTILNVTKDDFKINYFSFENTKGKLVYEFELIEASDSENDAVFIGIGVGVAVLFIIIIVIIVALLCRRRSMKKSRSDSLVGFFAAKSSRSGSSANPASVSRGNDVYDHANRDATSEYSYATMFHNVNGGYTANGSDGQSRTDDGSSDYLEVEHDYDYIPADRVQDVDPIPQN